MRIRRAVSSDASSLVDFNQKMALETEGTTLNAAVLKGGVEAVFSDPN